VNLAAILAPLARLRLINYAVRLNGVEVFPPFPDREGRWGLCAAGCHLAISDHTRARVIEKYPMLDVVTCDLSLGPGQTVPEAPAALPADCPFTAVDGSAHTLGERVLLHVGRMAANEQYKGQDVLIQAMPRIAEVCPEAQLVLVGRGDDAPRLLALAQAQPAHIQRAIFMPGFVPDDVLDRLYAGCYLFAMPSRGEGFGFVYIEAMRWAKPCIGSKTDAARCVIQEGVTGLLVDDPSNPDDVADKVIALLRQPDRATQLGAAGRRRVQEHFTYEQFTGRFLEALNL
jgi:glycosyltransferase involved in cell wall biosynthesis